MSKQTWEMLDTERLHKLLAVCDTRLEKLIVVLLSTTRLRPSEACSLKRHDLNLNNGLLTVQDPSGRKTRTINLTPSCIQAMADYIAFNDSRGVKNPYLFIDRDGRAMNRNGLYQRIQRLGRLAGLKVSPNSFRRGTHSRLLNQPEKVKLWTT